MLRRSFCLLGAPEVVKEFGVFQLQKSTEHKGVYEIIMCDQNDPRKLNLMNFKMIDSLLNLSDYLSKDLNAEARVAILTTPKGVPFSGGLDLQELMLIAKGTGKEKESISTKVQRQHKGVRYFQDGVSALARCRVPIICAMDRFCIGGATSLATACDMRYATRRTLFTVKEAKVGLAADIGVLQRLPHIVGEGTARELAYTAREFDSAEALRLKFIDGMYEDYDALMAGVRQTAAAIAGNSPLAVQGTKHIMNRRIEGSIQDSLDYLATWNAYNLLCDDTMEAAQAFMQKRQPDFKNYMLDFDSMEPTSKSK